MRARLGLSIADNPSPQKMSPKVKSPQSGKSRRGQWLKKLVGMRVYPDGIHVAEDQSFDWRIRYDEEQLEKFEVEGRVRWKRYRDPADPKSVQMTKPIFARPVGGGAFEVLAEKHIKPGDPLLVEDKLRYNLVEKSSWSYIKPSDDSDISSQSSSVHQRLDNFFNAPMYSKTPSRWGPDPEFPSLRIALPSDTESDYEYESGSDASPRKSSSDSDSTELRYSFQSDSSNEVEAVSKDGEYHALTTDEAVELSTINIQKAQTILANIEKTQKEAHAIYGARVKERQARKVLPETPLVDTKTLSNPESDPSKVVDAPELSLVAESKIKVESGRDEIKQSEEVHDVAGVEESPKQVEKNETVEKAEFVEKAKDGKPNRQTSVIAFSGSTSASKHKTCCVVNRPKHLDFKLRDRRCSFPYRDGEGPETDPSKPRYRHRPCFHHGINDNHKEVSYHSDYLLPDIAYVRPRRASLPSDAIKFTDTVVSDITNALKSAAKSSGHKESISKSLVPIAKEIGTVKATKPESSNDESVSTIFSTEKKTDSLPIEIIDCKSIASTCTTGLEAKPLNSDDASSPIHVITKDEVDENEHAENKVAEDSFSQHGDAKRDSTNDSTDAEQEFLDDSDDEHEFFDDLSTAEAPFLGLTKVEDEQAEEAKAKISTLQGHKDENNHKSTSIIVPGPANAQVYGDAFCATSVTVPSVPSTNSCLPGLEPILADLTYNPWSTPNEGVCIPAQVADSDATAGGSNVDDSSFTALQSTNASNLVQAAITSSGASPATTVQTAAISDPHFTPDTYSPTSLLVFNNKISPISAKEKTSHGLNIGPVGFSKSIDAEVLDLSALCADVPYDAGSLSSSSQDGKARVVYVVDQKNNTVQPTRKTTFSICSWSEGPDSSQNAIRKLFGGKDPNEPNQQNAPIEIVTLGPVAAKAALELSTRAPSLSAVDATGWTGQFEGSCTIEQLKRGYMMNRQRYCAYMGRPEHLNNVFLHKDLYPAPQFGLSATEDAYMRESDIQRIIHDAEDRAEVAGEMDRSPAENALRRKAHREIALARLDGLPIGEYRYYWGFLTVEEYNQRKMCVCFGVCECYIMCSRYADMICPCAAYIETNCH